MLQRLVLSLFVFLTITQAATAQPPEFGRWSGRTATTQAQGFRQGDPLVLTWSIVPDQSTVFNGDNSNLRAYLSVLYSGGFDEYQPLLQRSIGRWEEFSGLTIQYEPNDDGLETGISTSTRGLGELGVRGDIRFGGRFIDGRGNTLAFAATPLVGDIIIDTGETFFLNTSDDSLIFRNVIGHEFGHSLGFFIGGHVVSSDTCQLLEPTIKDTIDGPQYHEILSAQRAYGDINETGLGNDTVGNATELGLILDGDSVVLGESAHRRGTSALFTAKPSGIEIQPEEFDFISIDDQTDIDVFSFTVVEDGSVDIVLDTLGESYMAGGEGQDNEILFVTSERVNLTLELLDSDGQTVLATSESGGLGDDESLSGISLGSGTYFVRITGVDNPDAVTLDTQFYGLSVAFETTILLGDTNLDGAVNFLDISPFISILTVGDFLAEADVNEDGAVDFLDISPFISILAGG